MRTMNVTLAGLMIGAMALGGCATTGSVKRAQASADGAMDAAHHAQGSADAAGSAAQAANDAAGRAQSSADAAGTAAGGAATDAKRANDRLDVLEHKVSWLERKRWAAARKHKWHHKAGKKKC